MLHIFASVLFKIKALFMGSHLCKVFRCGRRASRLFVVPNKKLLDQRSGCARTRACMHATRSSPNISWAQQLCYSFAKTSCLALPSHVYYCVHITVCDLQFFRFGLSECTDTIWLTLHQEITHIHTGVCLCVTQHLLWKVYSILYDDFKYDSLKS